MSFGSSLCISYLVFKDDIFELLERYRVQKMASHDPILLICMARSHYHNSCEVNFRTILETRYPIVEIHHCCEHFHQPTIGVQNEIVDANVPLLLV